MAWEVLADHGSWSHMKTDDPDNDRPVAMALPGSWEWHEISDPSTILVRNDMVDQLLNPAPPPVINDYYPKPAPSGSQMLIGGSALDTCVRMDIVPQGEAALSVFQPYELQQENEIRFITPDRLSGPATIAAYNAAGETGGVFDMDFAVLPTRRPLSSLQTTSISTWRRHAVRSCVPGAMATFPTVHEHRRLSRASLRRARRLMGASAYSRAVILFHDDGALASTAGASSWNSWSTPVRGAAEPPHVLR
jgi:hypothetical protein